MKKNLKDKKSLNIAMLGHKRIPSREGGIEIVVEELATRMVTLGHKVTCYNRSGHHVSGKDFDGGKRKAYKGVRLKSVLTLDKKTVISEKTEGYIIRIKDNKILYESTSGGAFTALADYILKQNGIVYGAGYDNNMRVVCKRATTKQQLQEMRGSKFVQSDLGNIFQDIKKELKEGTTILFSGTPCQVAGLLSFLRKKPDNLLCVDFVCRGVPSPGLWDNYVKYMENKYSSKIVGARFKHKTYGYHTSTMKIDFAN